MVLLDHTRRSQSVHFWLTTFCSQNYGRLRPSIEVSIGGAVWSWKLNRNFVRMTEECKPAVNHVTEAVHPIISNGERSGDLSSGLYVQFDKYTRKNMNRFMFVCMDSLVVWSVLESIKVAFMPVGYIHEDIDQVFWKISNCFRKEDATSLADYHRFLRKRFKSLGYVVHMKGIVSWSGLCETGNVCHAGSHFLQYR